MKTRIIFTLILAVMTTLSLQAQEGDEEMKMLFNKKEKEKTSKEKMTNGGYGGVIVGWTQIDGKSALTVGGRAAWIANHHFALGLAGKAFFDGFNQNGYYDPSYDPNYDPEYSLAGGYGGLLIEPIVTPMSPVNVSFPILIGAGGVTATPASWKHVDYYDTYYYNSTAFFVAEAGVDVQFNITKFFRIAVGGGYRFTSDIYLQHKYLNDLDETVYVNVPKNAMRGFNADLTLKFGWF